METKNGGGWGRSSNVASTENESGLASLYSLAHDFGVKHQY